MIGSTPIICVNFEYCYSYILGEMYNKLTDTLFMVIITVSCTLIIILVYFFVSRINNRLLIFNKDKIILKKRHKTILEIDYDNIISIGTFRIYHLFHIYAGPCFLGIDYYDEHHEEKYLELGFSLKYAKMLKSSNIHPILEKI